MSGDEIRDLRELLSHAAWQRFVAAASAEWGAEAVLDRMARRATGEEKKDEATLAQLLTARIAVSRLIRWPEDELKRLTHGTAAGARQDSKTIRRA